MNENILYHRSPRPGKIRISSLKPCETQRDLSMAYSPGVADPCRRIHEHPEEVFDLTSKGNMVAVISDGSAVLGLGDIGPAAGIPVMEGKAVLFKRFAGIDSIGLCLDKVRDENGRTCARKVIETVERLEPCFGGINLEDIAAPACFEIEETLKKSMGIPVFHDDQHGTAIICLAGILNSLELVGKRISDVRIVINGAGAAGISCGELCIQAGADPANVLLCDSTGVIYKGRKERMTGRKTEFAVETKARTLKEAMVEADIFLGLSIGGVVSPEMISLMNRDPIVFAMANPDPEIQPELAVAAGAAVVGTGRSDFPNQVNNVLGFPGIFRGALDVHASAINMEMKMAAAKGLADLAKRRIPDDVLAYLETCYPEDARKGVFDGDMPLKTTYVIPKPFDPRVVPHVAAKVAEAAIAAGVARKELEDIAGYEARVAEFVKEHHR